MRELEHLVERFAVLHDRPDIAEADLPEKILRETGGAPSSVLAASETMLRGTLAEARAAFERGYVVATLQQARGNMAAAARQAGLDRSHYFRLVRRHGIEPKQYASPGPPGR